MTGNLKKKKSEGERKNQKKTSRAIRKLGPPYFFVNGMNGGVLRYYYRHNDETESVDCW